MNRPAFQTVMCRRGCGRMLSTLIRPVNSPAALHAPWASVCEACLTRQEKDDMLRAMTGAPTLAQIEDETIARLRIITKE